ncbi:hypothetical protein ONZ43_g7820 [Nemania bipapillata]|uniref:Uncharacterized protein n=1 Tax=Nemania bipapillata TaxID=110536 RepID=A0ACC2HN41_9PEZI|nr:hypothetical protein ONZ43_g7820 [Nemania bipapillata]
MLYLSHSLPWTGPDVTPPSPPNASFPRFSDLPPEIRLKIWGIASLKPRTIPLLHYQPGRTPRTLLWKGEPVVDAPELLFVNQEARAVAEKNYTEAWILLRAGQDGWQRYPYKFQLLIKTDDMLLVPAMRRPGFWIYAHHHTIVPPRGERLPPLRSYFLSLKYDHTRIDGVKDWLNAIVAKHPGVCKQGPWPKVHPRRIPFDFDIELLQDTPTNIELIDEYPGTINLFQHSAPTPAFEMREPTDDSIPAGDKDADMLAATKIAV